jgi:hypothetical protein
MQNQYLRQSRYPYLLDQPLRTVREGIELDIPIEGDKPEL